MKTSAMPPSRLKPIQIAAIVDYLLMLPATQQQKEAAVPPNRIQDYFGITYLPAVEWDRSPGDNSHSFDKRGLNLYAAGTVSGGTSSAPARPPLRRVWGKLTIAGFGARRFVTAKRGSYSFEHGIQTLAFPSCGKEAIL